MIFAVETEERCLYTFVSEAAAIAHCEGLDVEAAVWLFWDTHGAPLEPHFTVPNKRGLFTATNGAYHLVPASPDHHAPLSDSLDNIVAFVAQAPFDTRAGVEAHLLGARS